MSLDIFKDILPSIMTTGEYLDIEENKKSYNSFVVNKALSQHMDTLFHAFVMNMNSHLDTKMQYDYLFHSVRKYKRQYQKWIKNENPKELTILMEYYNCSLSKARIYMSLLTNEQIKILESRLDKGGNTKFTK